MAKTNETTASLTERISRWKELWPVLAVAGLGLLLASCGGREESAPRTIAISEDLINYGRAIAIGLVGAAAGGVWQWFNSKTKILSNETTTSEGKPAHHKIRQPHLVTGIVSNSIQGGIAGASLSISLDALKLLRSVPELGALAVAPLVLAVFGWLAIDTDK